MFDLIESGKFFLGAILCNGIGILSSYFSGIFQKGYFGVNTTVSGGDYVSPNPWYATLIKPSVWPPNFLFGPVWFSLYTTMGIGAVLIIESFGFISFPFILFSVQILLNFFWSIVFFNWHKIQSALIILYSLDAVYAIMLFSILFSWFSSAMPLEGRILEQASYVGCIFMLFIPFFLFSIIKNAVSSNIKNDIFSNILSWVLVIIIDAILAYLLFGLGVPRLYSNLSTSLAIFTMLFPTILWISFATYLNWKIKSLNP